MTVCEMREVGLKSPSKDGHKGQMLRRKPTRDIHVQDSEDASDRYASCIHTVAYTFRIPLSMHACSDVASKPVVNLAS